MLSLCQLRQLLITTMFTERSVTTLFNGGNATDQLCRDTTGLFLLKDGTGNNISVRLVQELSIILQIVELYTTLHFVLMQEMK